MRVLSLFSGIGGFDLGFQRAGMQVVGMCEIDKHAQKVLRKQFPDAVLHEDVKEIKYERGSIDLICGGFPCQDLSVAGKRQGLAGNRSGLWFEFARVIDEVEPKWVVIENVPGLFSSDGGRDLAIIIQWLAQRGYGVGWRMLDSQGFGLAQRRKRVFIIGSFGEPSGCTLLLESSSLRRDTEKSRKTRKSSARTTKNSSDEYSEWLKTVENEGSEDLAAVAWKMRITGGNANGSRGGKNTHPGGQGYLESNKAFTISTTQDQHVLVAYPSPSPTLISNPGGTLTDTGSAFKSSVVMAFQDKSPTLRAEARGSLMDGNGNINSPLAISLNGSHPKWNAIEEKTHALTTTRVEQVLWEASHGYDPARVVSNQDVSPTLSAKMGTGGNNVPLVGVRRLIPIECERLQGFPDDWTAGQADSHRYKQLGNAVAVPVAEWIGRRIMEKEYGK